MGGEKSRDLACSDEGLCVCPLEAQCWRSPRPLTPLSDLSLEAEGRRTVTLVRVWGSIRYTLLTSGLKRLVSMSTDETCTQFSPGQSYVCATSPISERAFHKQSPPAPRGALAGSQSPLSPRCHPPSQDAGITLDLTNKLLAEVLKQIYTSG